MWLGYDPNKQGRDDAALIVLASPDDPGRGKFRVLEKYRLNGLDFQGQADFIKKVAGRVPSSGPSTPASVPATTMIPTVITAAT